jgi:putative RecB family exonuclease
MQLATMRKQLHISYNQIWTYLECSLKYQFQYVERRDSEKVSLNLFFGSAIHACLERFYKSFQTTGIPEDISVLQHLFAEHLTSNVFIQDVPVIYKKDLPDLDCAVDMGCKLLEAFYKTVDLTDMEILGVELPLSTSINDDINLIGSIDLLLRDRNQNLFIVDNKTAAKPKSQTDIDNDLQLSGYSHLVVENGYVSKSDIVHGRWDVLRKLKTPKLEQLYTSRTIWDRRRFARIAHSVLAGIENRVFIPTRSWLCTDCQFSEACAGWR